MKKHDQSLIESSGVEHLFRVSVKAVIFNEVGQVLIVKESGRDWWDIPGGGMDNGETVKEALARELREEVSLKSDFEYEAILAEDPRHIIAAGVHQMRITFLVKPKAIDFAPGDDGDEVMFINPDAFKDSDLITERKIYEYSEIARRHLKSVIV